MGFKRLASATFEFTGKGSAIAIFAGKLPNLVPEGRRQTAAGNIC
ncbi:MAG: hypothetical protein RIE73_26375 [Coleofasciculus sp. C1-SOL-03]